MRVIGYSNATRYWQKYAFSNLPEGYAGKRIWDVPFHLTKTSNQFLLNTKWPFPWQGIDIYHTYNSIIPLNKPWVVEVESLLPRYGNLTEASPYFQWAIKKLKSSACKKILFTSDYTRRMNEERFDRWGVSLDKCSVVYRAFELFEKIERNDQKLRLIFIGNGFYRKGGYELLKAFQKIASPNIELKLVTSFEIDWAVFPTPEMKEEVDQIISNNKNISHSSNLNHEEIENELRHADVFVNVTYADSFNNSIAEAMACGLPVLVSNIRAIPEFVKDSENGFTLDVQNQTQGDLIDSIAVKIERYLNDGELLVRHGKESKQIIRDKFTLEKRNELLKKIYDNI